MSIQFFACRCEQVSLLLLVHHIDINCVLLVHLASPQQVHWDHDCQQQPIVGHGGHNPQDQQGSKEDWMTHVSQELLLVKGLVSNGSLPPFV